MSVVWSTIWREYLKSIGNYDRERLRRAFNQSNDRQVAAEYLMFVHSGGKIALPMPHDHTNRY